MMWDESGGLYSTALGSKKGGAQDYERGKSLLSPHQKKVKCSMLRGVGIRE